MPLVRFELKNEYGLGDSRLFKGSKKEVDPGNILSGFTVSGLVGILRQLGDLAEFAAVVFHDVHQQVISTAARGQKVLNHIQKIETALPQFEKAVQEQKSHIHFVYRTGCDWHANSQTGQGVLFASDLPEFMMDSYEGCRGPPHLQLLDKFDSAGSGACLKRYSDPSYFRRLMSTSKSVMVEGAHGVINVQKGKKQRSRGRKGLARPSVHMTLHGRSLNSSIPFAPIVTDELRFSVDDASISDTLSVSDSKNELMYLSSDNRSCCLETQNTPSSMSTELYEADISAIEAETKRNDCIFNNYSEFSASDYMIQDSMHLRNSLFSSSVSSDEKTETVESVSYIPSLDIPGDAFNNPTTAEFCSVISNEKNGNVGLRMQMEHVSSWTRDEIATETCGKIVSSTYSASCDEKNGAMESSSPKFPDDTSNSRSPDLARGQTSVLKSQLDMNMDVNDVMDSIVQTNIEHETGKGVILIPHLKYDVIKCEVDMSQEGETQPTLSLDVGDLSSFRPNSEFLLLTLEASNQHPDMTDTKILNQENGLTNTMIEISEPRNQLNKHMDASDALDNFRAISEYQNRSGEVLLPHLNYYGIDCEVDKIIGVISPSMNDVDGDIFYFKPQASNSLFLTLELPNQHYETSGTEISNQENDSLNYMRTVVPSSAGGEIRELSSQSNKQVNVASAFDSDLQTNFGYQSGVILLSNQNYDMESEINKIQGITTTCIDDADGEIVFQYCTSLEKKLSPIFSDHMQPAGSAEFAHRLYFSAENTNSLFSGNTSEDFEAINNIIHSMQAVTIDGILPELSSSLESFHDISAKTAIPNEVISEHQTKQEVVPAADSNCRLTEYQSSIEKVIGAWNVDPVIETHVSCCSSSDDYVSPVLSDTITSNTADNINSPTHCSVVTSSRCPNRAFSPGDVSEDPDETMCTHLTNTSVILPSNIPKATTVAFQGSPVDSHRKSSISIWTNGGLLGLEPSKPPDISVSTVYCSDKIHDDRSFVATQPCVLGNRRESRTSFNANELNHMASFPEKDEFTASKGDETKGSEGGSSFSKADIHSRNKPESNLSKLNNFGIAVGFSSPAHTFPVRSSMEEGISPLCVLMNKDGTSILNKHRERPKLAISSTQFHGFPEKFVSSSLNISGCQSPPLERMKASQPQNSSDASKLRLEFCNIHLKGNMGDVMFPSFQLLSEPFCPPMDGVLESDDDTFCRSCTYSSDDLLALYSESDAETWGEDELDVSNRSGTTASILSFIDYETYVSRLN